MQSNQTTPVKSPVRWVTFVWNWLPTETSNVILPTSPGREQIKWQNVLPPLFSGSHQCAADELYCPHVKFTQAQANVRRHDNYRPVAQPPGYCGQFMFIVLLCIFLSIYVWNIYYISGVVFHFFFFKSSLNCCSITCETWAPHRNTLLYYSHQQAKNCWGEKKMFPGFLVLHLAAKAVIFFFPRANCRNFLLLWTWTFCFSCHSFPKVFNFCVSSGRA